ncbi:D-glycero-beta-D-manno-heptose 1,7-bisphosphate 7-phosphatase [Pseudoalteromonas sp. T1lg65]|uniref:D-glycero-beta-D-manno-heptose 1,7-bisphosphate 7-phosphatase n=1 Tax=Pseudoalteromonas sp. T1lg65 TaxID=2077101 RepID=UPI003F7A98BE
MNKAIFLDRDGVINVDRAYVHQIADFQFIDGVFEACRRFVEAGFLIVVVTNQSGIGRGYYDEQQFHTLTDWMIAQFAAHNVPITSVYFCPHHPDKADAPYKQDCECRKPAPGMLNQAIIEHQIEPSRSIMVGDKVSDIKAARAAGLHTAVLVESGQQFSEQDKALADGVCSSLASVPDLLEKLAPTCWSN